MNRIVIALAALALLSSCGQAEDKVAQTTGKSKNDKVDAEARTIEQAADEAAKLVETESVAEIKEAKTKGATPTN
jgi:uncharacterized protein YceK